MIIYNCPQCDNECELYAESCEGLSVYCEKCDLDFTDTIDGIYEDYASEMSAQAEYLYEGDR